MVLHLFQSGAGLYLFFQGQELIVARFQGQALRHSVQRAGCIAKMRP